MKKLILSIISFFVIASVPIVAYAIQVNIFTGETSAELTTEVVIGGKTAVLLAPCGSPPCTAIYGSFTITDQSATSRARVFLNIQPTYKTLVLTNAIIRNATGNATATENILIQYFHSFGNVAPGAQQYYSLGMSGFFKRGTGTALAAGSKIELKGFGLFVVPTTTLAAQITDVLTDRLLLGHTVGTTNSFVDPSPSLKDNFSCEDIDTILHPCLPVSPATTVPTFLRIDVSTDMRRGDSLTVSSSFDSVGADNEADRDLAQALLNLPVEILSGTVNLGKNGVVPVVIYGSEDYDPTHPITGIDPNTVEFMGAFEKHGRGHIEFVNSDQFPDLVLHFEVKDTFLQCGDSLASLTGETVDGKPIGGSAEIKLKCK